MENANYWNRLKIDNYGFTYFRPCNNQNDGLYEIADFANNTQGFTEDYGLFIDYIIDASDPRFNKFYSIEQIIINVTGDLEFEDLGHKYYVKSKEELNEMLKIRGIKFDIFEYEEFNYLSDKIKELEKLYDKLSDIDEDLQDVAEEEFVTEFHCSYEFNNEGVSLTNSDTEDMTWTINDFVESRCKNWKEFSIYLANKKIEIYKKHLNNSIGD